MGPGELSQLSRPHCRSQHGEELNSKAAQRPTPVAAGGFPVQSPEIPAGASCLPPEVHSLPGCTAQLVHTGQRENRACFCLFCVFFLISTTFQQPSSQREATAGNIKGWSHSRVRMENSHFPVLYWCLRKCDTRA